MAGIPPLAGFFVKYFVLIEAFIARLTGPTIIGLATSLLSAFYYIRLIKVLQFEKSLGAMMTELGLSGRRLKQLFILEVFL
jgi:NADH-quinone oxidoreductase subunit N